MIVHVPWAKDVTVLPAIEQIKGVVVLYVTPPLPLPPLLDKVEVCMPLIEIGLAVIENAACDPLPETVILILLESITL